MPKVIAVCTSIKKGTRKTTIPEGTFRENFGLLGDAHADCVTHRQVSLLATESIAKMKALGLELGPGDFAENITTEGIDLVKVPVGTKITVGDMVVLEISQHGKECHTGCAIRQQVGKCIMPVEGVFAKVIKGGVVRAGDEIEVETRP
jgi:MOSC domain-containing protein YiiM